MKDIFLPPVKAMSAQQLEKSLARLKMESDERYDALWAKYTKQMEQDAILIAHLKKQQKPENFGPSEFSALGRYLKGALLTVGDGRGGGTDIACAFESLVRIVTELLTPSYSDSDKILQIREELKYLLED